MCRSKAAGGRRCLMHTFRPETPSASEVDRIVKDAKDPATEHQRLHGGQSGYTELITTPAGDRVVHKMAANPRDLYADKADHRFLMDGEVLVSELADAVGAPLAKVRRSGPDAVYVEYVEGASAGVGDLMDSPAAVRIGLVDTMAGYRDRTSGLRATETGLRGFDSGGAWLDVELDARGITPFTAPGGPAAPPQVEPGAPARHFITTEDRYNDHPPIGSTELGRIRIRVEALRPKFEALGRGVWLDSSLSVLDQITARAARSEASG